MLNPRRRAEEKRMCISLGGRSRTLASKIAIDLYQLRLPSAT